MTCARRSPTSSPTPDVARLSLHGTSGLADGDVRKAIELGIAKFNVNTELRDAYLAATGDALPAVRAGADVLALNQAQADAVAEVVAAKLALSLGRSLGGGMRAFKDSLTGKGGDEPQPAVERTERPAP